jgi:hypothetical protein
MVRGDVGATHRVATETLTQTESPVAAVARAGMMIAGRPVGRSGEAGADVVSHADTAVIDETTAANKIRFARR